MKLHRQRSRSSTERKQTMKEFTWCDNHPAKGGPHLSRALFVQHYFDHPADVVMCTARLGKRQVSVCKSEYLVLGEEVKDG